MTRRKTQWVNHNYSCRYAIGPKPGLPCHPSQRVEIMQKNGDTDVASAVEFGWLARFLPDGSEWPGNVVKWRPAE